MAIDRTLDAADSAPDALRARAGVGTRDPAASPLAGARGTWAKLGVRERRMLRVGGVVLGLLLVWWLAVRPAWTALRDSATRLPTLDAQLKTMQRLASESKELRGAPRLPISQAAAALKTATDTLGATGKLTLAGERATLTLTNASGEQIKRWLVDARTTARARTIEVKLNRAAAGYSGTVVVSLPAAN